MSIRVMTQVWDREDLTPHETLVMLCLADHADDAGTCYPSVSRVARKTGMKPRGVQGVIARLRERGLIQVTPNAGRNGTNLFTLTPAPHAPPHPMHPAPHAPTPRTPCTTPPAPHAPKPSLNRQEPSLSLTGEAKDPIDEALSIYREAAAEMRWPDVQVFSKARQSALKARLKDAGGVDGWRIAIDKAKASDFLNGRSGADFKANFDFLTQKSSFTKLMEGNYDPATRTHSKQNPNANPASRAIHDAIRMGAAQRFGHGSG